MLVPVVHSQTPANTDHKELAAALKLLAGFECQRDAQQAHTMLVRLTESDQQAVADDARTVLGEGLRKDWFGERKPFYQDLVALASRTAGGKNAPAAAKLVIALLIGLVALALGVFLFLQQSGGGGEPPYMAIAVGVLIVIVAGIFAIKR